MLADALALLTAKRKPLLVCGGGVKYSQAGRALREFAERFGIPFAETRAGKGTVPSDHEFNLGGIGETGCPAANTLARQADLVIGVGTRYTDFTTSSKWLFQHPDVSFLNINVSAFDAGKLDGVQVLADAREALNALARCWCRLTTAPAGATPSPRRAVPSVKRPRVFMRWNTAARVLYRRSTITSIASGCSPNLSPRPIPR